MFGAAFSFLKTFGHLNDLHAEVGLFALDLENWLETFNNTSYSKLQKKKENNSPELMKITEIQAREKFTFYKKIFVYEYWHLDLLSCLLNLFICLYLPFIYFLRMLHSYTNIYLYIFVFEKRFSCLENYIFNFCLHTLPISIVIII